MNCKLERLVRIFRWLFVLRPAHIQLCVGLRKIQNRFEWMGLREGWVWTDANARRVGNTLRPIVGFFLTVMGGFVAALNIATMFPSATYEASWGKVVFATALAVFGGFLNKSNAEAHASATEGSR